MFNFISAILRVIFIPFSTKRIDLVIANAILKKENEILKRKRRERLKLGFFDKLFYACIGSELIQSGTDEN